MGADLKALSREAGMLAVSRIIVADPDIRHKKIMEIGSMSRIYEPLKILNTNKIINSHADGDETFETIKTEEVTKSDIAVLSSMNDSLRMVIEESSPEVLGSMESSSEVCDNIEGEVIDTSSQQIFNTEIVINGKKIENSTHVAERIQSTEQSKELVQIIIRKEHEITATVSVEMKDFLSAAKSVQPSAKREGFAVVPDVTWGTYSNQISTNKINFLIQSKQERN